MEERVTGGMNGDAAILGDIAAAKQMVVPKREAAIFRAKEAVLAAVMLVIGFLYWELVIFTRMGAGVTGFAIILCAVFAVYMKCSGITQSRRSLVCLGLVCLASINFVIFDGSYIKFLNLLFLSLCFIAWVAIASGRCLEKRLSIYLLGDAISQMIIIPFCNYITAPAAVSRIFLRGKKGKGFFAALLGFIVVLPVLIIVTNLLISADAAFQSVLSNFASLISSNIAVYIVKFILGIPVALYLYGLAYGNVTGRAAEHITVQNANGAAEAVRIAPKSAVYTALTAMNLLYLLFFLSQAAYLFSAFSDILPETMTYAEYARRGFFELCAVSGINLFIISTGHVFIKRETKEPLALRVMTVLLSVFTLLLIGAALSKMFLYIKYYGLTQLRVYTTWFMVLLFLVFLLVLIRQLKVFNASRAVILCFIVCFMALCYGNVDGMIAKYNLQSYEQGEIKMMSQEEMSRLSDGAVPYLYEAYQVETGKAIKVSIYSAITGDYGDYFAGAQREPSVRDFNIQNAKATRIREKMRKEPPAEIEKLREGSGNRNESRGYMQ